MRCDLYGQVSVSDMLFFFWKISNLSIT
jgi:hypothetical protein